MSEPKQHRRTVVAEPPWDLALPSHNHYVLMELVGNTTADGRGQLDHKKLKVGRVYAVNLGRVGYMEVVHKETGSRTAYLSAQVWYSADAFVVLPLELLKVVRADG